MVISQLNTHRRSRVLEGLGIKRFISQVMWDKGGNAGGLEEQGVRSLRAPSPTGVWASCPPCTTVPLAVVAAGKRPYRNRAFVSYRECVDDLGSMCSCYWPQHWFRLLH